MNFTITVDVLNLISIMLSLLTGVLIGYERERSDKPCGVRTMVFIILGATMATIISYKWAGSGYDSIRLASYYIVAIGFVGGGIITRRHGKLEGITTAALLLPLSLIGMLYGMHEYSLAVITSIIAYAVLESKYFYKK